MPNLTEKRGWRYLGAILLVAGAALVQSLLGSTFADPPAFFLFLIAIALAARMGGLGPGLLAMAAGIAFALAAGWARLEVDAEVVRLLRFVALAATISWVCGSLRAETRKARRNAEELQAIMDATPGPTFIAQDPDCTRVVANRAGYDFLGVSDGTNLTGNAPYRMLQDGRELPPQDLPLHVAARTGRAVHAREIEVRRADGTVRRMLGMAAPLFDDRGRQRGAVASFVDVSVLRETETELRLEQERNRVAVELAELATWDVDLVGGKATCNEIAFDLLGMEAPPRGEGVALDAVLARIHPEDRDDVKARMAAIGPFVSAHRIVRANDGGIRHLQARGRIEAGADGRPMRFVGAAQDVTAEHETRAALERHAAELERSNRELERFAYIASHDLQEPLRTISTFGALVHKRFGDAMGEEGREYLQYMVGGANRLSDIVQDLLTYARAGRRRNLAPTDSAGELAEALKLLAHLIRSQDAQVKVVGGLPVVTASDGELVQVFANLIGNAIKFAAGRPEVEIRAERNGEAWRFSVRDQGVGIHRDHHERVFGLFQRLSTDMPGTGVGLAICKRIVESLDGRIWIESAPGMGTTVHFTLPDHPRMAPPERERRRELAS